MRKGEREGGREASGGNTERVAPEAAAKRNSLTEVFAPSEAARRPSDWDLCDFERNKLPRAMVPPRPHTQTSEPNESEWNPWPVELETGDAATDPVAPIPNRPRTGADSNGDSRAWHTIQTLESELERKERRTRRIIERYERVIEEKQRETEAAASTAENTPRIIEVILRFVPDR